MIQGQPLSNVQAVKKRKSTGAVSAKRQRWRTSAKNVGSRGLKMANVAAKIKVMPSSPDTDLDKLQKWCKKEIVAYGGEVFGVDVEPVAFGLKSLTFTCLFDEKKGGLDALEEKLSTSKDVNSAEVVDVRRAVG